MQLNNTPFLAGRSSKKGRIPHDIVYENGEAWIKYDPKNEEKKGSLQGTAGRLGPYVLNRNPFYVQIVDYTEESVNNIEEEKPKFKMSVADTDDTRSVRDAIRENEKTLKLLAKLNGGDDSPIVRSEKLSRRQMNAIARELCERYGSSAKYKEVADILYEAFGPIFDPSVEVELNDAPYLAGRSSKAVDQL